MDTVAHQDCDFTHKGGRAGLFGAYGANGIGEGEGGGLGGLARLGAPGGGALYPPLSGGTKGEATGLGWLGGEGLRGLGDGGVRGGGGFLGGGEVDAGERGGEGCGGLGGLGGDGGLTGALGAKGNRGEVFCAQEPIPAEGVVQGAACMIILHQPCTRVPAAASEVAFWPRLHIMQPLGNHVLR